MNLGPITSANASFDPADTEESSATQQYLSKKDLRNIGCVLVFLVALVVPIFAYLKADSEKSRCRANMRGIAQALIAYAQDNSDRLPPLFESAPGTFSPNVVDGAVRGSWAANILRYMGPRTNFVCPSAKPEEKVWHQHPERSAERFATTYGMYAPMATVNIASIGAQNFQALATESVPSGNLGTYNPERFRDADGNVIPQDGFVVGLDDSNEWPTDASRLVTRLAFYDQSDGEFTMQTRMRHRGGIHVVMLDGSVRNITPPQARLQRLDRRIEELWTVPSVRPNSE